MDWRVMVDSGGKIWIEDDKGPILYMEKSRKNAVSMARLIHYTPLFAECVQETLRRLKENNHSSALSALEKCCPPRLKEYLECIR